MTASKKESAARAGRRLIRIADRAALATLGRETGGHPHVSLVAVACDQDASPLLLLSALADHTRNVAADDRVSLLFDGTAGLEDPLAGERLTVVGRVRQCGDPRARRRFLARHPAAASYADFADFAIYRVAVERGHLIAGFGAIHRFDGNELLYPSDGARAIAEAEAEILARINEDHARDLDLIAADLLGRAGRGWRLTGIDPEGCDLRRGARFVRLDFPAPADGAAAARAAVVALARRARHARRGPVRS